MASVDFKTKTITLKIVYYGCAMGGKTTNLETLHQLTDPQNETGLVSIATKDDRTLFFDLLPMDLGRVAGLNVKVKLYTVPGQVHYELTRRQVLAGTDGVVMVIDSDPGVREQNAWALENLRFNLKANGFEPETLPTVIQWNKRDLPNARKVEELQAELNPRRLPETESIATTGHGVVKTFATILKAAVVSTYAKAGKASVSESVISKTIDAALAHAQDREPKAGSGDSATFDHRFDMDAYRDQQADQGRDKRIIDEETLLAEAVHSSMKLGEQLDGYKQAETLSERRSQMMQALGKLAPLLTDPSAAALPVGVMKTLVDGAGREHGSMLMFRPKQMTMDEREVVPGPADPLNAVVAEGIGSTAFRLGQSKELKVVDDLQNEVFFGAVPEGAGGFTGALTVPLACDGADFGALVVYSTVSEPVFDDVEQEYWSTAAILIGLSLHWRALRKKLTQVRAG